MRDKTYGWTVVMQLRAAKQGLTVREALIRNRRRVGVSKISGTVKGTLFAGWKIIMTNSRYR